MHSRSKEPRKCCLVAPAFHQSQRQIQERCVFPVLDASKEGLWVAFEALLAGESTPTPVASANIGLASKLVEAWPNSTASTELSSDECLVCAIAQSEV